MIKIEHVPWDAMVAHAERTYPNECCGAMLGRIERRQQACAEAVPLKNAFDGEQAERYELSPDDLLAADKAARDRRT